MLKASLPGLSLPPNHEELDHRTMSKLSKICKVASVRVVAIFFFKDIITTLKTTKIQVLYVVWQNVGEPWGCLSFHVRQLLALHQNIKNVCLSRDCALLSVPLKHIVQMTA